MSVTHVVGIDPGLVHTGVVRLVFNSETFEVIVDHLVVSGILPVMVRDWTLDPDQPKPDVFIEAYNPRQKYGTDKRMIEGVSEIRKALPGSTVLDNTGVKKIITRQLMELVGVWRFSTVTNHQDLRSAARIALLGMAKNEDHNRILASVVSAHLNNNPWTVVTR